MLSLNMMGKGRADELREASSHPPRAMPCQDCKRRGRCFGCTALAQAVTHIQLLRPTTRPTVCQAGPHSAWLICPRPSQPGHTHAPAGCRPAAASSGPTAKSSQSTGSTGMPRQPVAMALCSGQTGAVLCPRVGSLHLHMHKHDRSTPQCTSTMSSGMDRLGAAATTS